VNKQDRVGIDVSQYWVDVERVDALGALATGRFDNDAAGHRKLCAWLTNRRHSVRVVLEATGVYHRKLALALAKKKGVEVMVANPMAVKSFGDSLLQRARTDATSAHILREFAERMEFVGWVPPSQARRNLQAISRRIEALGKMMIEEKNRLHGAKVDGESEWVLRDLRKSLASLKKRREELREAALEVIAQEAELQAIFELLVSIKGVGAASAIAILGELAMLPADLSVRQWVAYAGLDPKPVESGTSVRRSAHISRQGNERLRSALYMPALVAKRFEPNVRAFAEHLSAKGKSKLVVTVAVMRKLLHAIYGMVRTMTAFDGEKFYRMRPIAQ
jgi:transposase